MGMDNSCRYKTVMVFGILQLLLGVGILICGIMVITNKSWLAGLGHGIWGGVFIILTGCMGLFGGINRKKGLVIAFMVLSILSTCGLWLTLAVFSLGGAAADAIYTRKDHFDTFDETRKADCIQSAAGKVLDGNNVELKANNYTPILCTNGPAALSNFIIMIMGGSLLLFAILSSAFACCAVCKCCGAQDQAAPQKIHASHA